MGSTKNIDINSINYFQNIAFYYYSDDYYYIIDSKLIDSIRNKLIYIDGFCNDVLSKGFVQLFTLNKDLHFEKKEIDIRNMPEPDWAAKTFWLDNNYYYGVGMFSSIRNENEAWKRSEEKAIYSVFSSLQVDVTAKTILEQNNEKEFLINAIKTGFACEINNIEPLERWIDIENEIFYTLVRININDLSIYGSE